MRREPRSRVSDPSLGALLTMWKDRRDLGLGPDGKTKDL